MTTDTTQPAAAPETEAPSAADAIAAMMRDLVKAPSAPKPPAPPKPPAAPKAAAKPKAKAAPAKPKPKVAKAPKPAKPAASKAKPKAAAKPAPVKPNPKPQPAKKAKPAAKPKAAAPKRTPSGRTYISSAEPHPDSYKGKAFAIFDAGRKKHGDAIKPADVRDKLDALGFSRAHAAVCMTHWRYVRGIKLDKAKGKR